MTHTVADLDTYAEVLDAQGRRVSRHDVISDAYAEAARLNGEAEMDGRDIAAGVGALIIKTMLLVAAIALAVGVIIGMVIS